MHPKCRVDKWSWFDEIGYKPHAGQLLFHKSEAQNRVQSCGWGWGKSMSAARDYEPLFASPETRIWVVGPDYGLASREFSVFWADLVVKKRLPMAEQHFAVRQGNMILRTPDAAGGSVVEVKSERNPQSLEAEDVDAIIYAEAAQLKHSTYERCQGRLRMGGEQCFLYTPEGFNWTYRHLWLPSQDSKRTDWWGRRAPAWENPYLSEQWLEDMKRTLTQAAYEAKVEGRYRTHTGFVFADFDPKVHVTSLEYEPQRLLYGCADYGFTNPFVLLDVQVNADDQVCIIREYYKSFVTTPEHAAKIKGWERPYRKIPDDPSGADQHEVMRAAGLPVHAQACEVETGNELIQELLKVRPDGKPGMLIDASCENTIREFTQYKYPDQREDAVVKEAPLKMNDHCPEAFKRFVSYWTGIQRAGDLMPSVGGKRVFRRESSMRPT